MATMMGKKLTLVLVTLLLAPLGALMAGEDVDQASAIPAEQSSAESAGSEATACKSRSAQEVVEEWRNGLESRQVGTPPPCPQTSTCGGLGSCSFGGSCEWSGQVTEQDTGLSQCQLPGGGVLSCHGHKTVHVTTIPCDHCPCCSATPSPCPCPNDCGENVTLSCEK